MDELKLSDFRPDNPWSDDASATAEAPEELIDGVQIEPLILRSDDRGALVELITTRNDPSVTVPHVYQVFAEPGSIRGWVYHERQSDRLAYTHGSFRLVLFDIRESSQTKGVLNVLDVGKDNPCRVTIPPFVVHGLANIGDSLASFVNVPTNFYDPGRPDKQRLPYPDDRIPYRFN